MSDWKVAARDRRIERQGGAIESQSKLSKAQGKSRKPFKAMARYEFRTDCRFSALVRMVGDKDVKLGRYSTLRAAEQACDRARTARPFVDHCASIKTWVEAD